MSSVESGAHQSATILLCDCESSLALARLPPRLRTVDPDRSLIDAVRCVAQGGLVYLDGSQHPCTTLDALFREWGDLRHPRTIAEAPTCAGNAQLSVSRNELSLTGASSDSSRSTTVRFSVITNTRGTPRNPKAFLTKTIQWSESGGIGSTVATELTEGQLEVVELETPQELVARVERLSPSQALMFGVPRSGVSATPIVSRSRARAGANGVTRTLDDIDFPRGGGLLFLDFDRLPPDSTLETVAKLVQQIAPAFSRVPMVLLPSASSHIFDTSTGREVRGLQGVHGYVWLDNAADAPEIAKRLRNRMILAGYGWCFMAVSGTPFVRVPFDMQVFQPIRLVYSAGAVCSPPLVQRRGKPIVCGQGGPPLTLDSIPELTEAEREQVEAIECAIVQDSAAKSAAKRAAYRQAQIASGIDARSLDRMLERRELVGEFPISFADGGVATVEEILAEPAQFHERDCYDPEEPEYQGGKVVGKLYTNGYDGAVRLHSFAHGGRVFTLVQSPEARRAFALNEFSDGENQGPRVRRFTEVESTPIEWLLRGRLARREITMVNGWPGEGKTTVVIDIVAKLTRGQALPDGTSSASPLTVLVLSTEDNASVLKLRLQAAGADLNRCLILEDKDLDDMRLPSGRDRWTRVIREHGVDVVVVDPMMAFLDDKLKSIAEQDARRFMQTLRTILLDTNAAGICIRHPNKATAGGNMNAVSASSGSLAFTAAARIEMLVGRTPNSEDERALVSVKNNLAAAPVALRYRIKSAVVENVEGGTAQDVAAVDWLGTDATITADDLLTRRESREVRSRLAEARVFLEDHLANGPVEKGHVLRAAKMVGIQTRTLERAREEIGWTRIWGNLRHGGRQLWGLKRHTLEDYQFDLEPSRNRSAAGLTTADGWNGSLTLTDKDRASIEELVDEQQQA